MSHQAFQTPDTLWAWLSWCWDTFESLGTLVEIWRSASPPPTASKLLRLFVDSRGVRWPWTTLWLRSEAQYFLLRSMHRKYHLPSIVIMVELLLLLLSADTANVIDEPKRVRVASTGDLYFFLNPSCNNEPKAMLVSLVVAQGNSPSASCYWVVLASLIHSAVTVSNNAVEINNLKSNYRDIYVWHYFTWYVDSISLTPSTTVGWVAPQ